MSPRMSLISNTALAFSMSADAFAASVAKGVKLKRPKLSGALRIGAIFGFVETLTPLIGWAIGIMASRYIEAIDHWVAFAILGGIGGNMVYESLKAAGEDEARESHRLGVLILTAISTSIDSMAVGVTLALVKVDIFVMAAMIGGATFLMATIGIMTGHYLGTRVGKLAELGAGLCLIAIGSKILLEHLGYI
jgi:manganese efflux pump family protein